MVLRWAAVYGADVTVKSPPVALPALSVVATNVPSLMAT